MFLFLCFSLRWGKKERRMVHFHTILPNCIYSPCLWTEALKIQLTEKKSLFNIFKQIWGTFLSFFIGIFTGK